MTKKNNKSGFSLVEIMVASLLIAVLALGGAAVVYHTESVIGSQSKKRLAIDQAIARMELVKRTRYSIMRPATTNIFFYFVDNDQDDLLESGELGLAKSEEIQKEFPMLTAIRRIPPPTTNDTEYLVVNVSVKYDPMDDQESVALESLIVPDL